MSRFISGIQRLIFCLALIPSQTLAGIPTYANGYDVTESTGPLKRLWPYNFFETTFLKTQNLLVLTYSASDETSKRFLPVMEDIAEHYKDDEGIWIAKYDVSAPESIPWHGDIGNLMWYNPKATGSAEKVDMADKKTLIKWIEANRKKPKRGPKAMQALTEYYENQKHKREEWLTKVKKAEAPILGHHDDL